MISEAIAPSPSNQRMAQMRPPIAVQTSASAKLTYKTQGASAGVGYCQKTYSTMATEVMTPLQSIGPPRRGLPPTKVSARPSPRHTASNCSV